MRQTCGLLFFSLLFKALKYRTFKIMSNFATPLLASELITRLGQRIRIARIRRNWSVVELATKAGINRNTLTALELGKPGTAIGVCVTVLWALGLEKSLDEAANPDSDVHGKALEASRRPTRAGKPRKISNNYDF